MAQPDRAAKIRFNDCVRAAKDAEALGKAQLAAKNETAINTLRRARIAYADALRIVPAHDKLTRKLAKLDALMDECREMVAVAPRVALPKPRTPAQSPPATRPVLQDKGNVPAATRTSHGAAMRTPSTPSPAKLPSAALEHAHAAEWAAAAGCGWQWEPEQGVYTLPGGLRMPAHAWEKLYHYQRQGVAWMWSLHPSSRIDSLAMDQATLGPGVGPRAQVDDGPEVVRSRAGGILADDMGLGKTRQTVAFIAALFASQQARSVLIVAPLSLLTTWEQECRAAMPTANIGLYHGTSQASRRAALQRVRARGGILLTTYGMVTQNAEELQAGGCKAQRKVVPGSWHAYTAEADRMEPWDVLCADESHILKNAATQRAKAMRGVPARMALLITGTPVQNNLDELWALLDLACHGRLLGTRSHFQVKLANVILAGQDRAADELTCAAAQKAQAVLQALIAPHVLRRVKGAVSLQVQPPGTELAPGGASTSSGAAQVTASAKKEVVVWTKLSPVQEQLYTAFLHTDEVKTVLNSTRAPLAAISVLRKMTLHPLLLAESERVALRTLPTGSAGEAALRESLAVLRELDQHYHALRAGPKRAADSPAPAAHTAHTAALVSSSGKLQALAQLMRLFKSEGSRVLIFSNSKRMLDVVGALLREQACTFRRIDGDITDTRVRARIVDEFNRDTRIAACLLTTGVGALGLTLTGANRVVILNPDWNPAVDAQAVDRAYRIGQTQHVVTYRLVTCGTVEEAAYKLQIFKGGLTQAVLHASQDSRMKKYLSRSDFRSLFQLGNTSVSETAALIHSAAPAPAIEHAEIEHHIERLLAHIAPCTAGMTHHDHLYAASHALAEADQQRQRQRQQPQAGDHGSGTPGAVLDDETQHMIEEFARVAVTPAAGAAAAAAPRCVTSCSSDSSIERKLTRPSRPPMQPLPRPNFVIESSDDEGDAPPPTAQPASVAPPVVPATPTPSACSGHDSDASFDSFVTAQSGGSGHLHSVALCKPPTPAALASPAELSSAEMMQQISEYVVQACELDSARQVECVHYTVAAFAASKAACRGQHELRSAHVKHALDRAIELADDDPCQASLDISERSVATPGAGTAVHEHMAALATALWTCAVLAAQEEQLIDTEKQAARHARAWAAWVQSQASGPDAEASSRLSMAAV